MGANSKSQMQNLQSQLFRLRQAVSKRSPDRLCGLCAIILFFLVAGYTISATIVLQDLLGDYVVYVCVAVALTTSLTARRLCHAGITIGGGILWMLGFFAVVFGVPKAQSLCTEYVAVENIDSVVANKNIIEEAVNFRITFDRHNSRDVVVFMRGKGRHKQMVQMLQRGLVASQ